MIIMARMLPKIEPIRVEVSGWSSRLLTLKEMVTKADTSTRIKNIALPIN